MAKIVETSEQVIYKINSKTNMQNFPSLISFTSYIKLTLIQEKYMEN